MCVYHSNLITSLFPIILLITNYARILLMARYLPRPTATQISTSAARPAGAARTQFACGAAPVRARCVDNEVSAKQQPGNDGQCKGIGRLRKKYSFGGSFTKTKIMLIFGNTGEVRTHELTYNSPISGVSGRATCVEQEALQVSSFSRTLL